MNREKNNEQLSPEMVLNSVRSVKYFTTLVNGYYFARSALPLTVATVKSVNIPAEI